MKLRGQGTIVAIMLTFVSIVLFAGLLPALTPIIATAVNDSTSASTDAVLNLLIPMIAIGILFSFILYVIPSRRTDV